MYKWLTYHKGMLEQDKMDEQHRRSFEKLLPNGAIFKYFNVLKEDDELDETVFEMKSIPSDGGDQQSENRHPPS